MEDLSFAIKSNEDFQDRDLNFDTPITCQQLLDYCHTHNDQYSHTRLIKRVFQAISPG